MEGLLKKEIRFSIDETDFNELNTIVVEKGMSNVSELIRDLINQQIKIKQLKDVKYLETPLNEMRQQLNVLNKRTNQQNEWISTLADEVAVLTQEITGF